MILFVLGFSVSMNIFLTLYIFSKYKIDIQSKIYEQVEDINKIKDPLKDL